MVKIKKIDKERRKFPRVKCDFVIQIEHQKSFINAHAINISASGMYLESDQQIPLFREIGIGIKIPGVDEIIECTGVVVRSEEVEDKNIYNTAIFFEDIEQSDKDLLAKYVESQIGA